MDSFEPGAGKPAPPSTWTQELALLAVSRPARYAGLVVPRQGATEGAAVSAGLLAPDVYEDAMGDPALLSAARSFARAEGIAWDLFCAPWMDHETGLRNRRSPLTGLVSRRDAGGCDLLCVVTRDELQAPTVLAMLDLAGVPPRREARDGRAPIVLVGGRLAWNPEPFHAFADAFLSGEIEPLLDEVLALARHDAFARAARPARLAMLAGIAGVYVPAFYAVDAGGGLRACNQAAPARVTRRVAPDLEAIATPAASLVPLGEVVRDAAPVEVQRGCGGCCRACRELRPGHAPARRRDPARIARAALDAVAAGGWDDVALVAPRGVPSSHLEAILDAVVDPLEARRAAITLPVLRPGDLTPALLRRVARLRRTRLVLAPEISGEISDWEPLLAALEAAGDAGWRAVDLLVALGPAEVEGVAREILPRVFRQFTAAGRRSDGSRLALSFTLAPFIPRAHTAYQWDPVPGIEGLNEVTAFHRSRFQGPRVRLRWDDSAMIATRARLALGGRELAAVIESAWRRGARFSHRRDVFDILPWSEAFAAEGIALGAPAAPRDRDAVLPWSHLDMGTGDRELLAYRDRLRDTARAADCHLAGLPDRDPARAEGPPAADAPPDHGAAVSAAAAAPAASTSSASPPRPGVAHGRTRILRRASPPVLGPMRVRMCYGVHGPVRFLSHLDMVRIFDRLLRRASLPVEYSQGGAPHPRISFGPPRAVGMSSVAEYVDIGFTGPFGEDRRQAFAAVLPAGMSIRRVMPLYGQRASLDSDINAGAYRVTVAAGGEPTPLVAAQGDWDEFAAGHVPGWLVERAHAFESAREATLRRVTPKKVQEVDVRASLLTYDWDLSVSGELALHVMVAHGGQRRARPSEVAAALLGIPTEEAGLLRIERTGLYWKEPSGSLRDPFGDRHEDAWSPVAPAPHEPRRRL